MAKRNTGFSLIEVVISASIITAFISALIGTHNLYLQASHTGPERAKALYLAEEGIENIRFVRDQSWGNLSSLPLSEEGVDGFVRKITLTDLDAHTKRVDSGVSWSERGATSTVSLSAILTNLYDN